MSTIYVVVLTYIKPLEEVDRAIPAHIEWLKKGYADGLFLASGRRIPAPAASFWQNAIAGKLCKRV
ncbi:hypothetical protein KPZU09_64670 [Klebsiella pneumoniae]|uniref:YCII-related domain-containing protein n=1 Tax=Klebsiella pneumoniae TaxID=573 RepID=A0A919I6D0_KLEPN|nr:hypothetical protein KPZU09_64670 [Klebsiella pneumoniae]